MDVGSYIKAMIKPMEQDYEGLAEVIIGPIQLDYKIRQTLDSVLVQGGSKFHINLLINERDSNTINSNKIQSQLILTNDLLKISPSVVTERQLELKLKFTLENPAIETNNAETTKFVFIFTPNEEEFGAVLTFFKALALVPPNQSLLQQKRFRLAIEAPTRTTRDLIILSLRCFSAKNYLVNSKVIHSLDGIFQEGKVFQTDSGKVVSPIQGFKDYLVKKLGQNQSSIGDLLLEIDLIKKEFYEVANWNSELERERKFLSSEIVKLEEELSETIETYTKLIGEMKHGNVSQTIINESMISIRGKREDFDYRTKFQKVYQEKKQLEQKLRSVLEEVEMLRNLNKNEGYFTESRLWVKGEDIGQSFFFQKEQTHQQSQIMKENNINNNSMQQTQMAMQQIKVEFERLFEEEKQKNKKNIETIAVISKKLNEYERVNQALQQENSQLSQRSFSLNESGMQGFKQFENRLKEYKKLNELLLNEVNSLKTKNSSLVQDVKECGNKITKLQSELCEKNEQSIYRISSANDQIFLENNKRLERMLSEQGQKNEYLQQSLQQEINEKKSLQTQLSIFKHKQDLIQTHNEQQQMQITRQQQSLNSSRNEKNIIQAEQQLIQSFNSIVSKDEQNLVSELKKQGNQLEAEKKQLIKITQQSEERINTLLSELQKKEEQLFHFQVQIDKLKLHEETLNFKLNCLSQQNTSLQESQILMVMEKDGNNKECQTEFEENDCKQFQYQQEIIELQEEILQLQEKISNQERLYEQESKDRNNTEEQLQIQILQLKEQKLVQDEFSFNKNENQQIQNEISILKQTIENYQMNESELNKENSRLRSTIQNQLIEQDQSSVNKITENINEIQNLKLIISNYQINESSLKNEIQILTQTIEQTQSTENKYKNQIKEQHQKFQLLQTQNNQLQQQLQTTLDLETLEEENSSLKQSISSLEMLNQLQKKLQQELQEELEQEKVKVCEIQQQFMLLSNQNLNCLKSEDVYKLNENFAQEKIILQQKVSEQEDQIKDYQKQIKQLQIMDQKELLDQLKESNSRLMLENFNLMEQLDRFNNSSMMIDTTFHNINEQLEDVKALKAKIANLELQNEELGNEKDQLVLELSKALQN